MAANHPAQHPSGQQYSDQPNGPVLVPPQAHDNRNPAADLIRQKLAGIYGDEPNAQQEMTEAQLPGVQHSKHQQYMLSLHSSGRSASQIQTAWHQYYLSLDDLEKRQVWQEFYDQSAQARQQQSRIQPHYQYQPEQLASASGSDVGFGLPPRQQGAPASPATTQAVPVASTTPAEVSSTQLVTAPQPSARVDAGVNPLLSGSGASRPVIPGVSHSPQDIVPIPTAADPRQPDAIRQQLRQKVTKRRTSSLKVKHHLQSLLFGLGFGTLTLIIVLFGFFNEVIIAPFIQPSRNVSATPIIISPDGVTASDKNEVIIPKINVEIPLDFSASSTEEKAFEAALDKGVAHYPTTAMPGQQGNASFFGHSSNNIFNPGKYKFAFVLLNELVPGDTFYITYNHVAYAYTVYDKKIVEASAVEILNPVQGKSATAMLVTCDPPGTSLRRLAVWGEQISPSPNSNTAASATTAQTSKDNSALPGNGPTLWGRIKNWVTD